MTLFSQRSVSAKSDIGETAGVSSSAFEYTLLRVLAGNIPHRIYAKDIMGRFIFANGAVARGMGVSDPAELLGKTDFDFYPFELATEYNRQEQEILTHGRSILNQEEHARYLLLKDEAWMITTKVAVRDDTGQIIGLVGINYEVTTQKAAGLALQAAHAQAAEATVRLQANVARLDLEVKQRQRFERNLRHQAMHDNLTGLPNRALLMDRIEQAIEVAKRQNQQLTLLFLDFDRFKIVNDSLGHAAGDELLRIVTGRIVRLLRPGETLARIGGDEFVLVLANPMPAETLANLTSHLSRIVARPVHIADREVCVTCSLGYSVYPQDGKDATTLLKHADAAMYEAKKDGGNRMRRYAPGLSSQSGERLEVETQLKQALRRGEFLLHYQPQIQIASGHIVGVEALVRWEHPVRGLVPPMQFIPLAEESELIEAIGEWVLRTACAQAAAWQRSGLPAIRLAINVSARQFHDPALVSVVAHVLAENGLEPQHLELEITESMSMKDPEESFRILASFKALGISIAIDDFGTGYSNLAYLRQFPVRRIKLDRAFVSELGTQSSSHAIVEAIVAMAHKLDLQVVAEGVETAEQRDHLLRYGCDELQGYWFSRPVDAAALGVLLHEQHKLGCGCSVDVAVANVGRMDSKMGNPIDKKGDAAELDVECDSSHVVGF
ncbi:EAL domain-containing protein (plasmid) [Lichenicola cladoniae]|uniref:EAL domain-containing protein n=1 Tax=Lichenicola cladoniae TaxID=1484109 RepID=A0A6M8I041_9PROT|nr:GGDEF and EAL domain-containing protein [Lichenicola cladoniae]NPD69339.1 EAL domain-containing protein [Acetobacteraceae bacterium]QKE93671.1 EAL domain-containing protein [Lichenicola cladoniae]